MQELDIWKELGIEKTKDEKAIKKAYYVRLKQVNPEDDPEGFKVLRAAYDEAAAYARADESEEEQDEYDLWINEVQEVYDHFLKRTDPSEWEKIFNQEICCSLDTQDMAAERLLAFMMNHYYVPYYVWNKMEEIFGIKERKESLCEKFPGNYIEYVISEIGNTTDDGYYDQFEGNLEGNLDELIQTQSQCFDDLYQQLLLEEIDQRNFSSIHEKLEAIHEMDVRHLFTQVIEATVAFYEKDVETVKRCFERLKEKLGEDTEALKENSNLLQGFALGYEVTGEKEKADALRNDLAEHSDRLYILSDCVRYFLDAGDFSRAKDLTVSYMEKYADYPVLVQYMVKANEKMILQFRKEAEEGNEDSVYELGWIYFQNEQYQECIDYIRPHKPEPGAEKEYTYYNLLGRCLARNEQYDEAIPCLIKAHQMIKKVKEKGAQGEEEERMLRREGLILATIAMSYHEKARNLLEKNTASSENYRQADKYLTEAVTMIEESVSVEKNMRDRIYFQREKALIYFDREEYSKCIDTCDEMIQDVPEWYLIYLLRGQAFYKMDYPQNVIDDFYTITRVVPENLDNPHLYISPIMTYLNYSRYDNVKELFEFAQEHGAKSPVLDMLKLYYEYEQEPDAQKLTEIKECLGRLLTEKNDFSKKQIAEFYIFAAYVTDEESYFAGMMEEAGKIYPGCARRVSWYLGNYYERNGEYQKAISYFDLVVQLSYQPADIDANLLRVGKNHWYMDEDDEAFRIYQMVYTRNPSQPTVNRCLAEFYLFKFRADEKEETIDTALRYINDQIVIYNDEDILRIRAEILLEKYDIPASKTDLLQILENDPDSVTAMRLLERVYRYEGDFENAYEICLKLLDRESDDRYRAKYEKYICSCLALRKYEKLEKIIKDGFEHDREWAFEKLDRLYTRQGRYDELMEASKAAICNGKTTYEKFLGYRTVLDVLCAKGASWNDSAVKKAVKEYVDFIKKNPDRTLYGYDCLYVFYFENYGNTKEAIKYIEQMQKGNLTDYYKIKSNLVLATLYGMQGNSGKAIKYHEIFQKHVKEQFGSMENWLKEDGYSRAELYEVGLYYYSVSDIAKLEETLDLMSRRVICKNCDKCRCFEYYILKGHLEKRKGNKQKALEAYRIALDSGENSNYKYISRLIQECQTDGLNRK